MGKKKRKEEKKITVYGKSYFLLSNAIPLQSLFVLSKRWTRFIRVCSLHSSKSCFLSTSVYFCQHLTVKRIASLFRNLYVEIWFVILWSFTY
jgi:hypothetical protein